MTAEPGGGSINSFLNESRVFEPPAEFASRAHIGSLEQYQALWNRAKADPEGYKETGSFKVPHSGGRPSWAVPVIVGGKMYVREGDYLLCYDVKAK